MNTDVPPPWHGLIEETFTTTLEPNRPGTLPPVERMVGGALWYAEAGLPVFPLQPRTKVPYPGTHGVLDATTSPEVIWAWWAWRPESNVGLATGCGVDVIDLDGPEAHVAWREAFPDAEHWDEVEDLHVLATVRTPRAGGLHLYVPSNGRGNRAGMLDHVDYRGLGGYVVAPPSHTEVGRYRMMARLDPATVAMTVR